MPLYGEHQMQAKFDHIRKAVEEYIEFQAENNIMENGETRWDYYKVQRKVVAAANWYNGYILVGARHWDSLMQQQATAVGGSKLLRDWAEGEEIQGFVDQYRNFLTREEAAIIALEAGQIEKLKFSKDELFSEDLY